MVQFGALALGSVINWQTRWIVDYGAHEARPTAGHEHAAQPV